MTLHELQQRRKQASDLSLGLSGQPVYTVFEDIIASDGLCGSILDFGAGQGEFTKRLLHNGQFKKIMAADLMERPAGLAPEIEWMKADLNYELPGLDEAFDVISAVEVIEHLENPRAVVRSWARMLKPGGTILFSTPNNESLRALLALVLRGHYVDFGDGSYPAHITALLRKDLERILTEEKFGALEFHYSDRGTVPKFTRLTWQQISVGLLRGRRFSDNVIVRAKRVLA
jgi:2-polyprenyl-3-methyl-5-hydroxy-6-metoxy-1,4-benzoquinol methylase